MATLAFLPRSTAARPGVSFRVVAVARDDAGAPDLLMDVRFVIYNPVTGLYWDAAGGVWGPLVQNAAAGVNLGFDGIRTSAYDHLLMDPAAGEATYVVQARNAAGTVTDHCMVEVRHDVSTLRIDDASVPGAVDKPVTTTLQLWRALKAWFTHDQRVDDATKKLVVYRENGIAVAMNFDLTDAAGLPSVREPFRRLRDT